MAGIEDPDMLSFIAGHVRARCRYPSGQAMFGVETSIEIADAACDAMRSWNCAQRRRRKSGLILAPAPGEKS